jgi:hypothetical protein
LRSPWGRPEPATQATGTLADLIGLDSVLAICECLWRELGADKNRPKALQPAQPSTEKS